MEATWTCWWSRPPAPQCLGLRVYNWRPNSFSAFPRTCWRQNRCRAALVIVCFKKPSLYDRAPRFSRGGFPGNDLEAIDRAQAHVVGVDSVEKFERDPKAQDAVVRNTEVIGEAANKIAKAGPDFLSRHSDLRWNEMRAMRNKIIHDYFEVDYGFVWETVRRDLPFLAAKVRLLVADKSAR